jgi:integration host factor subunit alpha
MAGDSECAQAPVAAIVGRGLLKGVRAADSANISHGFMGLPDLKIKSKTTERNARRRRSGPSAGLRGWRPWEGAIVLRVDMANANAGREQGKTVTRADLSEIVYQRIGLSRTESAELVQSVLDEICDAAARGETVKLSGFGSFVVRSKGERIGRNPKTGVEVPILPRRVMVFKPSNVLKAKINGRDTSAMKD